MTKIANRFVRYNVYFEFAYDQTCASLAGVARPARILVERVEFIRPSADREPASIHLHAGSQTSTKPPVSLYYPATKFLVN